MDGDYQTWHLHYKVKLSSGLIYLCSTFLKLKTKMFYLILFFLSGRDVRDG